MYFSTAEEMEALDKEAVVHGLEIRQMMELAGFHMVSVFKSENISQEEKIAIVCGKGNKGGDGLSAARHLYNRGWKNIRVVLADENIKPDSEHHRGLVEQMQVPIHTFTKDKDAAISCITESSVVIDALIGYHLDGAPRGVFAELISLINDNSGKKIAYDLPSGMDATTGECPGVCISADASLTLALPKKVFQTENGKQHSGTVYLADIGIPAFLHDMISKDSRPDFGSGVILLGQS